MAAESAAFSDFAARSAVITAEFFLYFPKKNSIRFPVSSTAPGNCGCCGARNAEPAAETPTEACEIICCRDSWEEDFVLLSGTAAWRLHAGNISGAITTVESLYNHVVFRLQITVCYTVAVDRTTATLPLQVVDEALYL